MAAAATSFFFSPSPAPSPPFLLLLRREHGWRGELFKHYVAMGPSLFSQRFFFSFLPPALPRSSFIEMDKEDRVLNGVSVVPPLLSLFPSEISSHGSAATQSAARAKGHQRGYRHAWLFSLLLSSLFSRLLSLSPSRTVTEEDPDFSVPPPPPLLPRAFLKSR